MTDNYKTDLLDSPSVRIMSTKVERRLKQEQQSDDANNDTRNMMSVEQLARIGILIENTKQGFVSSIAGVLVFLIVSWPYHGTVWALWWAVGMIAFAGVRWLAHIYTQLNSDEEARRRWLIVFGVGATLNGLGWSVGLMLGMGSVHIEMHALSAFMLAGVVAGSVPLISAIPVVFVSFVLAIGLPFTIMVLTPWYSGPATMAVIASVFMVVLINVGLLYSRTLSQAILSDHDILTSLLNRRAFDRTLRRFLRSNTNDADGGVLCYLDIDRFKTINDTYGHAAGDLLICEVAKIMEQNVRSEDVLARFGGDEFAILLRSHSLEDGKQVAERIRTTIEEFNANWEGRRISTTVSMGVVVIKPGNTGMRSITTAADTALYTAKHLGRNRVHFHDPDDELERQRRDEIAWVRRLREGFIDRRLRLAMQQIFAVDPASGQKLKRYEILLRLITSNGQVISAGKFMSAAEHYGLTPILDRWVLDQTVRWLAANPKICDSLDWVAVNLSPISLADDRFAGRVKKIFNKYGVAPEKICFEISESTVLNQRELVLSFCSVFRPLGCRFSIDGCGRALDILNYLRDVPVDLLKIDGQFVSQLTEDKQAEAIVQAINDIGQSCGMHTIAGFVENKQTLDQVHRLGINFAQGFGLGMPFILEVADDSEDKDGKEGKGSEAAA